jgi:hypothetical protein
VLLVLLALFLLGAGLPAAGPVAHAGEGEEDGGEEEEGPSDFFEGDTSFSAKQVNTAIDKGVAWLRKKQQRSGSWGEVKAAGVYGGGEGTAYGHPAGPTALALYTLLKCKIESRHPIVKRGFDYIDKSFSRPRGSYETSVLLLAVCATADNMKTSSASKKKASRAKLVGRYRRWAQKLVDHLVDKRVSQAWRYQVNDSGSTHGGENDLSSTQLAALALFAAHKLGIKVKPDVWEGILCYSMAQQADDGPQMKYVHPTTKEERASRSRGFSYIKGDPEPPHAAQTGGMTACGIANVMMARFVLSDGSRQKKRWNERDDALRVQQSVYDGLAWLEKNWSPFDNRGRDFYHVYYLYGVERAMDLVGDNLIGGHPWYSEMGQALLNRQHSDGHWNSQSTHEPKDVIDTCFALLFLKRATKGAILFPDVTGGSDDSPADNR